jgi:hypothetical protein
MLFVLDANWMRASLAVVALLFDMFMFSTADAFISGWQNAYLTRFLETLGDFRLKLFPLDDLLELHGHKLYRLKLNPESFPGLDKWLPPLTHQFRAFVLRVGPGVPPPDHLTTFLDLNGSCVMFFLDERSELTPVQEFQLLHELGHGARGNAMALLAQTAIVRFVAFAAWVVLTANHSLRQFAVLAVVLAIQAKLRFRSTCSPWDLRKNLLQQELFADRFAVESADLRIVARALQSYLKYPEENKRLTTHNTVRNERLLSSLKSRLAGEPLHELPEPGEVGWRFSLANLISLAALAWFGQPITPRMLLSAGVSVITIAILYLFVIRPTSVAERELQIGKLEKRLESAGANSA